MSAQISMPEHTHPKSKKQLLFLYYKLTCSAPFETAQLATKVNLTYAKWAM